MDQMLVKAARVGDVRTMLNLLEADPEILERAYSAHFVDSALHVAALHGKAEFVEQIVTRMPSLATEANQQGMIPLHLASLKGHVETVRELLKAKLDDDDGDGVNLQCLLKDDNGRTPLHCAAQKGKISVVQELISSCPECLEQVTAEGETAVHIAVKANQFGAVKVLVDSIKHHNFKTVLKKQDRKGNTAYQLAVAKKQSQILELLTEEDEIREARCIDMGLEGMEEGTEKAETVLHLAVEANQLIVETIKSLTDFQTQLKAQDQNGKSADQLAAPKKQLQLPEAAKEDEEGDRKRGESVISIPAGEASMSEAPKKDESNELQSQQDAILVVGTLIITLTYQALASPPSVFLKEGSTRIDWSCLDSVDEKQGLIDSAKNCPALLAFVFIILNTSIFF